MYDDLSLDLGTVEEAAVVMSDSIKRAIIDIELSEEFILNWLHKRKNEREKKKSSKPQLSQNQDMDDPVDGSQLSQDQIQKLNNLYNDYSYLLDDLPFEDAVPDMHFAIENLAKDVELSEEFISNWLQKRKKEKGKTKKSS